MDYQTLPLRDIHLPAPISLWPPATGWWLVLGILGLASLILAKWISYLRRPTALRQALNVLESLTKDNELTQAQKNQALSLILRELAVTTHPRHHVAGLSGQAWSRWIQSQLNGKALSPELRRFLEIGPYNHNTEQPSLSSSFYKELREVFMVIANSQMDKDHPPLRLRRYLRATVPK